MRTIAYFISCLLLLACSLSVAQAADWPGFRGPQGNGISTETAAPLEWNSEKNLKWKVELPQPSNGSPIVSNGCVFVITAEDAKGRERSLYCFNRTSGAKHWVKTVTYAQDEPTHGTNPHGSTTPVANGKYVVAWHGSAGLFCYDFAGNELWKRELGEFVHMWGAGTSPVIVGERVIIHSGPGKKVLVAAFELYTGKPLWEHEEPLAGNGEQRPDKGYLGSWSTPLVAKIDDKTQILCAFPTRVVSYDPADGKLLWSCDGLHGPKGDLSYSSPVIAGDTCVCIGGFNGPGLGFKLSGASGNITEKHTLWRVEQNPQSIGSGVVVDGFFYRPNAGPGTIDCIDPQTGKIQWTERATTFWGSMVYVAGRCYVTGQDGTTLVFKPSPEKFELLAKNALGEGSNATPAISDGQWFLRTHKHLHCIAE